MSVVEPNADGKYECPECGNVFDTAQGLGSHRARSHGYRRDRDNGIGPAVPPVDQGQEEPPTPVWRPTETTFEVVTEVEGSMSEGTGAMLADAINDALLEQYKAATLAYLPTLANEVRRRGDDMQLVDVLITLLLDASN
jgi:uncharacterized C2H2 Zn-finger protein